MIPTAISAQVIISVRSVVHVISGEFRYKITHTSRRMVTTHTRPPAAKTTIIFNFFIRGKWSTEISVIGRAKRIKSVITLKTVSLRKTFSMSRHVPLVASVPCQYASIGLQMLIFTIVAPMVYAASTALNMCINVTHARYSAKNRASINRIDNLTVKISGLYRTFII